MKIKIASKGVIALLLSLLMVISMVTIGVVSASSAKVEVADTAANGTVTVYFENVRSWSNVYVCFLNGDTWNNNGVSTSGYTFQQMSLVSGKTYKLTYTGNYSQYIVFCKDKQDNYGNLWQTEASYRGDFNPSTPYFTPSATANSTVNSCTYYSGGSWAAAPGGNTDPTQSSGGGSSSGNTIYFENNLGWSSVYYCFFNSDAWTNSGVTTSNHTMQQMTKGSGNTYSATYSSSGQYVVFCKDKQDNYGNLWQTQACYRGDFDASKPYFTPSTTSSGTWNSTVYYSDGSWAAAPGGGDTTPTAPPVVGEKTRLAIGDDTNDRWLGNDNAQFKVVVNGAATAMTKSVDVASGLNIWYADVAKINAGTSIKFQRCSVINTATVWNEWTTSYVADTPLYKVGENDTITPAALLDIPDGSVTNFGYGIWVDTKGNANKKDFVKIYANDFVKNTTYDLYLPAYTDWSALKVYTNFPTCSINGTAVTKGQVNTLNLSASGIERTVSINYKRNASGSTHNGSLHIMRGGTASAMLLSTKADLYTGLAAAYAVQEDGHTPDYAGVAAYKSTVETKGDYMFYDKTGALLNPKDKTTGETLTGLKKLKARGNSTFEASMRLYGKTAYNITLNDKAPLIEGCESSKKYSLLANNADESLLRNATVYGIADAVGMPYAPNTRLIDLYDNGTYLGAYVLTEKVEYGKNTLIPDAKSSDKANEDILAAGKGIDYDGLKQKTATYTTTNGNTYTYQYSYTDEANKTYEYDGSQVTIGEGEEAETYTLNEALMKKYDFLLEHEIETRYSVEPTWFRSNRTKQAVVPKYPEFATQKQVQWMIEQYDALEDAAYDNDYARVQNIANVETFADVYLIQELTMNLDACATSYYILGGKTYPKLVAAPLWDYDWAAGQYNGKRRTVSNSEVDVADTSKTYVKNKAVSTGDDGRSWTMYNLQAQLCHQNGFWNVCKSRWTNKFDPVLKNFLGDGNTLLSSMLPDYRTAAAMNESRWGNLERNYQGAHGANPAADTWGTRSTITYQKFSNNFGVGQYYAPGTNKSYDNAVYYLNDWLLLRRITMSNSMGLYDATMIETEAPTEAPTDPPTEKPTDAPTEAPTEAPTDAPTQPETTNPDDKFYILGDVDGDKYVTVLDATMIQMIKAGFVEADDHMVQRGLITGDTLNIMDATAIQRLLAGYNDGYDINELKEYADLP